MEWHVRKATVDDIPYLVKHLRKEDIKEIKAASGNKPEESLSQAFEQPNIGIWVGVYKDNPEIIFGVAHSACPDIGFPWMVCTNKLKESPKEFIVKCKKWVNGFSLQFPLLMNFVHAENELHIRWLKWCGFKFIQLHEEYGHTKEPFWEFRMERK
jgi:hypothetical protein